jgi:plastocyanin
MKKIFLVAGAVALLVAAPAPAKTVTVDISRLGFTPAAVTVQVGDSVIWTNKDTVNHQVVCATCVPPFTSSVLAPGQTATYTFNKVGKFTVVDPLNKNKKGTVTVEAAPATVSLSANPRVLTYGATTTLSGALSTAQANQKLDILAQACGENAAKAIGNATTTTGGNFTFQTQPTLNTSYQAHDKAAGGTTSSAVPVTVRPVLSLTRVARGKFSTRVIAAQSFVGKAVAFQRWVATRHKWNTVKTVFLGTRAASATPVAGSTVSSTTFKARLRSGLRVRAVLPPGQAAPCYVAARSATVRS